MTVSPDRRNDNIRRALVMMSGRSVTTTASRGYSRSKTIRTFFRRPGGSLRMKDSCALTTRSAIPSFS